VAQVRAAATVFQVGDPGCGGLDGQRRWCRQPRHVARCFYTSGARHSISATEISTQETRTRKTKERDMPEVEVGTVNKYFDRIGVGMVQLTQGELSVGDKIHIKGNSTDLTATISSMQVQRQPVQTAKPGDEAGIKLDNKVRQNDKVYKVTA
jgi:translation initiation factor IF-2